MSKNILNTSHEQKENILTTTKKTKRRKKIYEDTTGDPFPSWKRLFTTSETAKILHRGKSTLEQARLTGGLDLEYVRIGNRIFYRREDIERFINNLPSFNHNTAEEAARLKA